MIERSCTGPIWSVDDISPCYQQRYFIQAPFVTAGIVSAVLLAWTVWKRSDVETEKSSDPAAEPLIRASADSYGALRDSEIVEVEVEDDLGARDAIVTTVNRGLGDRLRVAAEAVVVAALATLSYGALTFEDIYGQWVYAPSIPTIMMCFWAYAFGIVIFRLFHLKDTHSYGLWYHSTSLYPVIWTFATVQLWSTYVHPYSNASRNFYVSQFLLVSALVWLNFTAKVGDSPARVYFGTTGAEPSCEPVSSIFSLLSFSFLDTLIWKGYWSHLEPNDVWELREEDHAYYILAKFRKLSKTWFGWKLLKHFKKELTLSALYAGVSSILIFVPAMMLKLILDYVENPDSVPVSVAWLYVFGIFFFAIANNIVSGQALFIGRQICIRLRAVIVGEVYAKALRRKAAASGGGSALGEEEEEEGKDGKKKEQKGQANVGAIINLMAIDTFKVAELSGYLHYFVSAIFQIFIAIILLYSILDWSALVGGFGMICIAPINYKFSKQFSKFQKEIMALTDKRVEKTNEVLQSIRIIKFFAWEQKFIDQIMEIRAKELQVLKRRYIFWAFCLAVFIGGPLMVTAISFACYTLVQKRTLTSPLAFTSLALFNILRQPIDQLADMLASALQAKVSIDRVQQFLDEDETTKYQQLSAPRGANSPVVGFENASFSWGTTGGYNFKLQDIDIKFPIGKMTVIAGPTGSGKTSLLMALLGEMELENGAVFLPGSSSRDTVRIDPSTGFTDNVAYCSQQAWLLNDTVKNNILFASDYDEERYNAVIDACSLRRDLDILDFGDQTEIGEKGITLSGGQKQRVSLARAIYSRSRHLLLDDCLSAVDSDTALNIFENCLCGPLTANRTVLLVSHNVSLTVAPAAHVVLVDNGRIKAQGTPSDLVAAGHLDAELLRSGHSSQANTRASSITKVGGDSDEEEDAKKKIVEGDGKLVQDEERARGSVDRKVYVDYLSAMGKHWFWIGFFAVMIVQRFADVMQSWWLREWTVKGMLDTNNVHMSAQFDGYGLNFLAVAAQELTVMKAKHSTYYYLSIYFLIGLLNMFIASFKEIFSYMGSISASKSIFNKLLNRVMHAKSRFFDSTPLGRIMNRFSKDIETLDQGLAGLTMGALRLALAAGTTAVVIVSITPMFMVAGIFIFATYWIIGVMYLSSSRELKRMDSVSRSPIFQHFGETLAGISTIRAYGEQSRFIRANLAKVDGNNRPFYYMWVANRWLSFRVDTAGAFVSLAAAAFVMLRVGEIDSGLAGLSLSYALAFNSVMLWVVRFYASIEQNMNSVERLKAMCEVETEAPAVIEGSRPPPNWPTKGELEFKNLSLRYAEDLPLVIKDVSFKVESFKKVGIVGRTGAGKSTIITALFRILEADTGSVYIDGLDVSTIGLQDLRQALAIIPQDPTLFVGTIRSNLDPFDQYSDEQVFEALRRVHLISGETESVASGENANQFLDLSSAVSEGGGNLSQGQRQLMCLARSLLKSPKVLLLDEATASIDYDTDARIQKTIREEFTSTTLLTIAHRLRSIADYDKILVLDAGQVVEFDEPHTLLSDSRTVFYDMCQKSGELDVLKQLAEDAYNKARA